jgi:hypothetical protein
MEAKHASITAGWSHNTVAGVAGVEGEEHLQEDDLLVLVVRVQQRGGVEAAEVRVPQVRLVVQQRPSVRSCSP